MRTTITLDDELFREAALISGEDNASKLITKALELMVAVESKKRLLRLSGKAPAFAIPPRDSRAAEAAKVAEDSTDYPSQKA